MQKALNAASTQALNAMERTALRMMEAEATKTGTYMIGKSIYTLLDDATFAALAGLRVYPQPLPQNAAFPRGLYRDRNQSDEPKRRRFAA